MWVIRRIHIEWEYSIITFRVMSIDQQHVDKVVFKGCHLHLPAEKGKLDYEIAFHLDHLSMR